jgi:hypothetical protein
MAQRNVTLGKPYALVTYGAGGANPKVATFATLDQASAAFEVVAAGAKTSDRAFAGVFDKGGVTGAAQRFGQVEQRETVWSFTKIKNLAPWIVGGAALIAGAVYLTRGKSKGVGRQRRRATATWRRRIVTTWK